MHLIRLCPSCIRDILNVLFLNFVINSVFKSKKYKLTNRTHTVNLCNRVGGQTEREKSKKVRQRKKKNCDRELIGAEPWSETVDSVEKQCGYCETAVSAFSALTGQSQTRMHCL